ncbi:MAG: hypothetical protein N2260_02490 [Syntrophobacterales bacterium]|nr:hypothetical protein [Syntrophobacterales bacterium]
MVEIGETWSYVIDRNDILIDFSENFITFAESNGWKVTSLNRELLGRNIFDFIDGAETRHIYRILFDLIRQNKKIGPIPFRCDAPHLRRFMELYLTPLPEGAIRITTKLLQVEPREPLIALVSSSEKSQRLTKMCSMCKKIEVGDHSWVEIEDGLSLLKIFEHEKMPAITHGVCPPCFRDVMLEIERLRRSIHI